MGWKRRATRWVLLGLAAAAMGGCCILPFERGHGGYYGGGGYHRDLDRNGR